MVAGARTEEEAKLVREQLTRILSNQVLSAADRRGRLLRFLVERSLAGDTASLKQSVIALEVFDRQPDYDPKLDSLVRVEMGRLRFCLLEYYSRSGQDDPVIIEIPKGTYQPVFTFPDVAGKLTGAPHATEPDAEPTGSDVGSTIEPVVTVARFGRGKVAFAGVVAVVVLLLGAAGAWTFLRRGDDPVSSSSIVVLPFLNLTGNSADEYLTDSITDELTEALSESTKLRVVARTSAFVFKGNNTDAREIGRRVNADSLLEGSVAKQDGHLRIVVQLIRAHDGYHLWSRTYEASTETLLRVESEIATSTAQALGPATGVVTQLPRLTSTANPQAHDLYLRSKYYLAQRTPEALQTSLALAHQAIENDASFPLPYETVGTAEWVLGTLTVQSQKGSAERALAALDKALALDPRYGNAHALRAVILYTHDWDWPRADAEYEQALQLGSTKVHGLYGWSLATRGRFAEAHRHLQIAQELDPLAAGPLQNRSAAYYMARDYPNARRELRRWLELDPKAFYGLLILGTVDILDDRCASAQADFQKMADLYPELAGTQAYVAFGNAKCGHPDEARRYLTHVQMNRPENDAQGQPEFYQLALVYGALHDADHVIQCLQQAADHRESQVLWLKIDPDFDEFRRDPRYLELLRKIGF